MSPLARSLLALSCAALLRAACAAYPEYDPEHCTMITIGDKSGHIVFERKVGPTPIPIMPMSIPNQVEVPALHRHGIKLVEETVIVCSTFPMSSPPTVSPPPEGFSPIEVYADFNPIYSSNLSMTVYQSYKIVYPERPY